MWSIAKDWMIQGYKRPSPLFQFGITLKAHLSSRSLHNKCCGHVATTLWVKFFLCPILPFVFLTSLYVYFPRYFPINFMHITPCFRICFYGTQTKISPETFLDHGSSEKVFLLWGPILICQVSNIPACMMNCISRYVCVCVCMCGCVCYIWGFFRAQTEFHTFSIDT